MATILWDEAIKKALEVLQHKDQYAYFMGAKGEVLTDARMDLLMNVYKDYFSKYTAAEKQDIKNWSRGKIGFDCSGFVGYCIGDHSYSGSQIDHCKKKTTILANGVAGSVLWKPGHVGLDIGYGFFLHFPVEKQSCTLGRIREYNWQLSGESSYVNYTGADAR